MEETANNLTPPEAAKRLRASLSTLARWRSYGGGPKYIKRNGRVLYREADLDEYERGNERSKTRDDA